MKTEVTKIVILDARLIALLRRSRKWLRFIEDYIPTAQLRHGADPKPLRHDIDAILRLTK